MVNEIPPQEPRRFVQLYKEGYGIKRIAHKTGFSYSGIRKHLLKAGTKLRVPTQPKVTLVLIEKFRKLYESGWIMREIAAKHAISRSTVQRHLHKCGVQTYGPGRPKQISASARELTKEKAYILGVVGPGDGFLEFRKNMGAYRIKLDVTDREFAEHFSCCLEKVYGLLPKFKEVEPRGMEKKRKFVVTLQSKLACEDLLSYGVSFREKDWQVPEAIKNAGEVLKAAYLRGVADSQGSVCGRSIIIASKNRGGVKELCELAKDLGIMDYYVHENGFVVYARRSLNVFAQKINFIILRKARKLENTLRSYRVWKTPIKEIDKLMPEIKRLYQSGLSREEIAKRLGLSTSTIRRRLKEVGYICSTSPDKFRPQKSSGHGASRMSPARG